MRHDLSFESFWHGRRADAPIITDGAPGFMVLWVHKGESGFLTAFTHGVVRIRRSPKRRQRITRNVLLKLHAPIVGAGSLGLVSGNAPSNSSNSASGARRREIVAGGRGAVHRAAKHGAGPYFAL